MTSAISKDCWFHSRCYSPRHAILEDVIVSHDSWFEQVSSMITLLYKYCLQFSFFILLFFNIPVNLWLYCESFNKLLNSKLKSNHRYPLPRSTICDFCESREAFPKIESLKDHQAVMHAGNLEKFFLFSSFMHFFPHLLSKYGLTLFISSVSPFQFYLLSLEKPVLGRNRFVNIS